MNAVEGSIDAVDGCLDGKPLVVDRPTSDIARVFTDLGAVVVQEIAKLQKREKNTVRHDTERQLIVISMPGEVNEEFCLEPRVVRENDTSAKSIEEWTGVNTTTSPP